MDQAIRNKLRSVVTQCRRLLEESIAQQLQGKYDIYATGKKDEVRAEQELSLGHLSEEEGQARQDILAHFKHIDSQDHKPKESLEQLIREIAFTHLNRFCAYKMMEVRDVYVGGQRFRESVSKGLKSQGFLFYLADHPDDEKLYNGGHQDQAYIHFLNWVGDTLSQEIGVLFSRTDPANRVYPPQRVLDEVLDLLNSEELKGIWSEDETIGWVYQYFTPKELRDQARKESQAPRNSYELAFRNQFFTPRYVVEFPTDNTLGRIWYDMRKGETRLKDECRYMVRRPTEVFLEDCQSSVVRCPLEEGTTDHGPRTTDEILKQPVYIPHRPKKDPREIKILDPACGSGHFLLYCFGLLLVIYEEAYDDSDLGTALRADYPTKEDLHRALPGLILPHNLHGIDIDLRAVQIAGLALWLRCQRAYQEMGLRKDRPPITKSNVVCAEPMPGEKELLDDFLRTLRDDHLEALIRQVMQVPEGTRVRATKAMTDSLSDLVRTVWEKMRLASEAGSLLKIEEELLDAIRNGQDEWEERLPLFRFTEYGLSEAPTERLVRFVPADVEGERTTFWDKAETLVLKALDEFIEFASNGGRFQRKLFVDDAKQGLGFVDVSRRHYDVLLMNPPFGDASRQSLKQLDPQLSASGRDIGAAFVSAANERWARHGLVGTVLSSSPMFHPTFSGWRNGQLLGDEREVRSVAHLGGDVLDGATLSACAIVIGLSLGTLSSFFRLIRCDHKEQALRSSVRAINSSSPDKYGYLRRVRKLSSLPGSPIAYWISDRLLDRLRTIPSFEGSSGTVKQGIATADEFRFARAWWEIEAVSHKWIPYSKTSEYSPFWDDMTWVLNYENDGGELLATGKARVQGTAFFGRPGVTFPSRSVLGFNPRVHPASSAFGHTGPTAFPNRIPPIALLGLLASRPAEYAISLFVGSLQGEAGSHPLHYEVGVIQRLPCPALSEAETESLSAHSSLAVQSIRSLSIDNEISRDFSRLAYYPKCSLKEAAIKSHQRALSVMNQVLQARQVMDAIASSCFGFNDSDLQEMEQEFASRVPPSTGVWRVYFGVEPEPANHEAFVCRQLSIMLGFIWGRWDIRRSMKNEEAPQSCNPFSPPSTLSPGMLRGPGGLPATQTPEGYPLRIDWDGILVDDPDHPDDIIRRVRDVLEVIWSDRADSVEKEACEILGVSDLRDYFRKPGPGGFWDDHIKRYSKSRRKAPIYWLLQSSKKNYALWVYYHRLDKDILFKALLNYVEPKIRREETRLDELRSQKTALGAASKGAKKLDKDIDRQDAFLSELRDFGDKLRRAANLHLDPDLNDGVVLNIAPLWELVPWKEAKSYWDDLIGGKYEWSSIGKQLQEKGIVPC